MNMLGVQTSSRNEVYRISRVNSSNTTLRIWFVELPYHFNTCDLMCQNGEKDKEEASETILGPKGARSTNLVLVQTAKKLELLLNSNNADAYLIYLYITRGLTT